MKLLVDINIVLDVLLQREPWANEAAKLLTALEQGKATGYVAGHTVTTAYYVIEHVRGRSPAATGVADLLRIFEVVPVDKADLQHALALGFTDYEDAVQAVCALKAAADHIVTRDEEDFKGFTIPAALPGAILAQL